MGWKDMLAAFFLGLFALLSIFLGVIGLISFVFWTIPDPFFIRLAVGISIAMAFSFMMEELK